MTLWTPDGERRVGAAQPDPAPASPSGGSPGSGPGDLPPDLTPEQEEQARAMAHEMAQAREQLLEAEVATVLTNHALGIYELAALHITSDRPDLVEARLAVDALGVLVDGLKGRLGDGEPTLIDALANIKMAYVQRANQLKQQADNTTTEAPAAADAATDAAATDTATEAGADSDD